MPIRAKHLSNVKELHSYFGDHPIIKMIENIKDKDVIEPKLKIDRARDIRLGRMSKFEIKAYTLMVSSSETAKAIRDKNGGKDDKEGHSRVLERISRQVEILLTSFLVSKHYDFLAKLSGVFEFRKGFNVVLLKLKPEDRLIRPNVHNGYVMNFPDGRSLLFENCAGLDQESLINSIFSIVDDLEEKLCWQ